MNRYAHLKHKAIQLREKGNSIDDICKMLNKGKSTVWYWIRNTKIAKPSIFITRKKFRNKLSLIRACAANSLKYRRNHETARTLAEQEWKTLSNELKQFIMLYWCEGYKKTKHAVSVANSDPRLISFANKQMGMINYHDKRITCMLQIHDDQDEVELVKFWKSIVGDKPVRVLYKSNSGKLKGRNWNCKFGVLSITIMDAYLKSKIDVWIKCLASELNL